MGSFSADMAENASALKSLGSWGLQPQEKPKTTANFKLQIWDWFFRVFCFFFFWVATSSGKVERRRDLCKLSKMPKPCQIYRDM